MYVFQFNSRMIDSEGLKSPNRVKHLKRWRNVQMLMEKFTLKIEKKMDSCLVHFWCRINCRKFYRPWSSSALDFRLLIHRTQICIMYKVKRASQYFSLFWIPKRWSRTLWAMTFPQTLNFSKVLIWRLNMNWFLYSWKMNAFNQLKGNKNRHLKKKKCAIFVELSKQDVSVIISNFKQVKW